ncbi:MAG: hypothetical protein ACRC8S_14950 [Fimbriiglobus sp.]
MTQYLTITLGLIEAQPLLHHRLQETRQLLSTLHRLGQELKASHLGWVHQLREQHPEEDLRQIRPQALELAIAELEERLSSSEFLQQLHD